MDFEKTLKDITALKIQGAENVVLFGLRALKALIFKDRSTSSRQLISKLSIASLKLIQTRPTEPFLRNTLKFVFLNSHKGNINELKESFIRNINYIIKSSEINEELISKNGYSKIPNKGIVFTHCHSSTVIKTLAYAKKHKDFVVHNTEARPLYQGRLTAKELSGYGINVVHYIDSGAKLALKDADVMLIGCDAITPKSVINKIGSGMFAEIAMDLHIPVYVCTDSLKFDPRTFRHPEKIEMRSPHEVWASPPTLGTKIMNYAFEEIEPELITGIICEFGIFSHRNFISELKKRSQWLFKK